MVGASYPDGRASYPDGRASYSDGRVTDLGVPDLGDEIIKGVLRANAREWKMTALEPVWVPFTVDELKERQGKTQHGRSAHGPNGEDPDSGKWRLRWPNGVLYEGETISVSSLDTASECLEKWGLDKVHDFEKPENRKATLGNFRHDELERWCKYGTRPKTPGMEGVCAMFPAPGMCENEVFFGFAMERVGHKTIVIAGYIDARVSAVAEFDGAALQQPLNSIIYDLKTTGDFRWKKTAAQLRANIQAAAYALGEMLRVEAVRGKGADGTELVLLRWVYGQLKELTDKTKTPVEDAQCEIVRVEMVDDLGERVSEEEEGWNGVWITREEAIAVVAQYVPLAETLINILERKKAGELITLPKNRDSCESYGGCPWRKVDVEVSWEDTTVERKLMFDGGSERVVTIEKKEKKSRRDKACTPPPAAESGLSGFMARHKQEMAKKSHGEGIGGHAGVEKVLWQWSEQRESVSNGSTLTMQQVQQEPVSATKPSMTKPVITEKKMNLADRFSKVSGTASGAVEKPVEKPVEQSVEPAKAASGGIASRFAAKAGATSGAPSETKTADVKATSDGMASSGGAVQSGASPRLADKLKALKQTSAVSTAVANAPTNSVATGQVAVGINPPDAAPEMSKEQQIAEGDRLAAAGKSVESGEVIDGVNAKAQVTSGGEAQKPRRGRPAGTTKAASLSKDVEAAVDAAGEKGAIPVLELLAKVYLESGQRRHATVLLNACSQLEALDGAPVSATV